MPGRRRRQLLLLLPGILVISTGMRHVELNEMYCLLEFIRNYSDDDDNEATGNYEPGNYAPV